MVMGHSFGGLIVYSAVAQSLIEAVSQQKDFPVSSFADLILLINPAFEAARYLPVFDQFSSKTSQAMPVPVFVSVTAWNDYATKFWFPVAMSIASFGESTRPGIERQALLNTMGHIPRMITHRLQATSETKSASKQGQERPANQEGQCWKLGSTGPDVCGPFWNVSASPEVINGHDGIDGYVFIEFVRDLVIERMAGSSNGDSRATPVAPPQPVPAEFEPGELPVP